MTTRLASLVFLLPLFHSLAGCDGRGPGPTEFVSADGTRGQRSSFDAPGRDAGGEPGGAPGRTVEEGDIYRMLDATTLVNLNAYRGLQVIDLSDLDAPRMVGRLPVTGGPVEMYVVSSRAIVLLNGWSGYYGTRDDVRVERVEGGLVLMVDLADRARPVELARAVVPGFIDASRLAREGSQAALYVAATRYETVGEGAAPAWAPRTYVKRMVQSLVLDGRGHVLLVHGAPWSFGWGGVRGGAVDGATYPYGEPEPTRLRILAEESLAELSDVEIDSWAVLEEAVRGRALFQVPGGLLLVDVTDPAVPEATAYFPTLGWPSEILFEGRDPLRGRPLWNPPLRCDPTEPARPGRLPPLASHV